ncbi:MAG: hypothetical protein SH819_08325 [Cytophagales bacterium]|nr:hypothetical protein [Cytophagales bacterium]
MKKLIYLFLALLLPGLIFVFLKYAGENKFEVPVYFEEGVDSVDVSCPKSNEKPYRLPDSLWEQGGINRSRPVLMIFDSESASGPVVAKAVREEMGEESVNFIMDTGFTDSLRASQWRTCIFMAKPPRQTVLADTLGRIRGYYDIRAREEVDRLRLELKILLKRY